jgi:pseudouridine-5'-phosphate glycosidase
LAGRARCSFAASETAGFLDLVGTKLTANLALVRNNARLGAIAPEYAAR